MDFFSLRATSDLRPVPALDNFKSSIYVDKTRYKNYPASQKFGFGHKWKTTTYFYVVNKPDIEEKNPEKNKEELSKNRNKQIQHENNGVDVHPRVESTSHLRTDSSCLLLKYINSVLIFHLQL